ncbi:MAG: retroviral-like aspartic protease family protein [Elusimicrobiota bacterium]|nr:retroviral-like aspartic protease family protein [Elusimicrobiota bacterium]
MGHIYTDIELYGKKKRIELKKVLVDTGATFTVVKPNIIKSLDVYELPRKRKVELGNGKKVYAKVYAAEVKIGKHSGPAWLISFPGAQNLIGVETLESIGLRVDIKKRKIQETRPPGVVYFY